MGFYIRKSISAGPFRFNLSGSGLGMSVGVKGFRVGTGPRGNYVHMGRGGLYYRASIGGGRKTEPPLVPRGPIVETEPGAERLSTIESGDVLAMKPANGSDIVDQIKQKMALVTIWPWAAFGGAALSLIALSQPNGGPIGTAILVLTTFLCAVLAHLDTQRRIVVVMYDLDDEAVAPFKGFTEEFDKLATVNRIWNIDAAGGTSDWKRNAGAGRLVKRQGVSLSYTAPRVVKTNISIPSVVGGRQSLYFFPDVVLVVEGKHAGAISYDQLGIAWTTTVFIEDEGVPADAEVVGHTWRFVNKNGAPDRRFNNNRQIPQVRYLQMGFRADSGLRKILQFSRVLDHSAFDTALNALRSFVHMSSSFVPVAAETSDSLPALLPTPTKSTDASFKVFGIVAALAVATLVIVAVMFLNTTGGRQTTTNNESSKLQPPLPSMTNDAQSTDTYSLQQQLPTIAPKQKPLLPSIANNTQSTDTDSLQQQLPTTAAKQKPLVSDSSIIEMRNEGYTDLVNHNYDQALLLFRKITDQGDAYGPFYLGYLYETGHGVARNVQQALYWYDLSNQRGNQDAAAALIRLHAIPPAR